MCLRRKVGTASPGPKGASCGLVRFEIFDDNPKDYSRVNRAALITAKRAAERISLSLEGFVQYLGSNIRRFLERCPRVGTSGKSNGCLCNPILSFRGNERLPWVTV